jgi:hypothetical protein
MVFFLALAAVADAPPTCLHHLSTTTHRPVSPYDVAHDVNREGASFSCSLGLTASEVESDLHDILTVASKPACSGLHEILLFPFTIANAKRVANVTERRVCRYSRQIKGALRSSQTLMTSGNLQVVGWRGAFFRDGDIWLNTVRSKSARASLKLISIETNEPFPAGTITYPQTPPSPAR